MNAHSTKRDTPPSGRKSTTKRKITPEDLLRFQLVSDPQIAPDGAAVLFTRKRVGEKNEYRTNLWIVPCDGNDPRQFTSGGKDSHGRWSPDGTAIAFVSKRDESNPQIYTIPAAGGEAVVLTSFPEGSIGSFKWSPDGATLAVAFRETEPQWTKEAKDEREKSGASLPPRVIDDLYYRLDGDGYFGAQRHRLWLVDAATGKHRLLFDRDRLGDFSYDWSPDSSELVVSANTDPDALLRQWKIDLYRVNARAGKARRISHLPVGGKVAVCWSPDGRQIAYAGREGKEIWDVRNTSLFVCDAEGGHSRDLTGHLDFCLSARTLSDTADVVFGPQIMWSRDSRRVFTSFGWHGGLHVTSVAVGDEPNASPSKSHGASPSKSRGVPPRNAEPQAEPQTVTFHTDGPQSVSMGNLSRDGRRIALTVADQVRLAEVAVGELADDRGGTLEIRRLTRLNEPLLDELELSPAEAHWVESSDGTKVHVWVMKPVGFRQGRTYPAVLQIHGGPHAQYGETFFHEFQVHAAAGYVIVYSNPRGSKGYGEEHCIAIKGNWGTADWRDVQAVTAFIKKLPFVDAKRLGIAGGSYGGYMTNWAIGHSDDFAAAVTDRCVSNLVSMVGTSDLPLVPGEYWDGNSWDATETIWDQSPLKHFGRVATPTLVIHSEGDLRCNVEQGEQVFAALKLRGIPTRFVRYPHTTSHGLSRGGPPDLRLHRLRQIMDWWERYLKNRRSGV